MILDTLKISKAYSKMNEATPAVPAQNTVNGAQTAAAVQQNAQQQQPKPAAPAQAPAQQPVAQQKPVQQPVAAAPAATPATPAAPAQTAQPAVAAAPQKTVASAAPTAQQTAAAAQTAATAAQPQVKNESKCVKDFTQFKKWAKDSASKKVSLVAEAEEDAEKVVMDGVDGKVDGSVDAGSDVEDTDTMSETDKKTAEFLADTQTDVDVKLIGNEINKSWDDGNYRNKYRVTLKNPRGSMSYVFWDSAASKGEPSNYDVLYALAADVSAFTTSRDFEDFVGNFGYDIDDPKAKKVYKAVEGMYNKAMQMFSEEEIQRLQTMESDEEKSLQPKHPIMHFIRKEVIWGDSGDANDYEEETVDLGEEVVEIDDLEEGETIADAAWKLMAEYDYSWEPSTEPWDGKGEIWFTSIGDHSTDNRHAIENGAEYTFQAIPKNLTEDELLKLYKLVKGHGKLEEGSDAKETVDNSEGLVNGAGEKMITENGGNVVYLNTFDNDETNYDEKEIEMDDFDKNLDSVESGLYLAFLNKYDNRYDGTFGPKSGEYNAFVESFDDFKSCYVYLLKNCRGCEAVKVEGDGKFVYITLGHHDGVETYKVCLLNQKGEERYDSEEKFDITELCADEYIKPIDKLF